MTLPLKPYQTKVLIKNHNLFLITKSLQTDGLLKVLKGATSLTEVVRVTT